MGKWGILGVLGAGHIGERSLGIFISEELEGDFWFLDYLEYR